MWLDDELTFLEKVQKYLNKKMLKVLKKALTGYNFVENGFNIAMRLYYVGMCPKHLFFQADLTESGTIVGPGGSDPDDPDNPEDAISGLFTVDANGKQVYFAKGNLEYDGTNGYSFAAHQYDYGGYFGWGTGSNPTNTSTDNADYPSFDDWGNHIAGGWRTLSMNEWCYVIYGRADASAKRGAATVCGVHGMALLPDNWGGGTFTAGFNGWGTNVYDASSWAAMEDAGAVFLPAAGSRYGTELGGVGTSGGYWSSTPDGENHAYGMYCYDSSVVNYVSDTRNYGHSVRLVQDY